MKKLTINRETLRNLSTEDLRHVVGGYPPMRIPVSDTEDCGGGGDTTYTGPDCNVTARTCPGPETCPL